MVTQINIKIFHKIFNSTYKIALLFNFFLFLQIAGGRMKLTDCLGPICKSITIFDYFALSSSKSACSSDGIFNGIWLVAS